MTIASPVSNGVPSSAPAPQVLVVDDEEVVRNLASRILAEAGFRVRQASNGREALECLLQDGHGIECVVSDVVMPHLNGVRLMEQIARLHPRLPVILMSGYAAAQLSERGIAAPCSILAKPFTPATLVAEVRRCLQAQAV